jgi:hypothetical protein
MSERFLHVHYTTGCTPQRLNPGTNQTFAWKEGAKHRNVRIVSLGWYLHAGLFSLLKYLTIIFKMHKFYVAK